MIFVILLSHKTRPISNGEYSNLLKSTKNGVVASVGRLRPQEAKEPVTYARLCLLGRV